MINFSILKKILLLTLMLISLSVNAQKHKKAIKYFDLGVIAYNKQDYKAADSLFTLSAKLESHPDTYFNLAATKSKLDDRCEYCENLFKASKYGDRRAKSLYYLYCDKQDTIKYDDIIEENVSYYCVTSYLDCSYIKSYRFYKKYIDIDSVVTYDFSPNDTIPYETVDLYSARFVLKFIYQVQNYTHNKTLTYLKEGDRLVYAGGSKTNDTIILIDKMPEYPGGDAARNLFLSQNIVYSNDTIILLDKMPEYPSGDAARNLFLAQNIVYPKEAKEKDIQGIVYVTFIVEEDGTVNNVKLLRGIGGGCDEEALRVVKMMPKWTPGNLKGKKVRVQFNLPINFKLYIK